MNVFRHSAVPSEPRKPDQHTGNIRDKVLAAGELDKIVTTIPSKSIFGMR